MEAVTLLEWEAMPPESFMLTEIRGISVSCLSKSEKRCSTVLLYYVQGCCGAMLAVVLLQNNVREQHQLKKNLFTS